MRVELLSEGFWLLGAVVFLIFFVFVLFIIICWLLRSPRADAERQRAELIAPGDQPACTLCSV
jgi:heme/copper-type cytochrome/quinol oxidase subunit 2